MTSSEISALLHDVFPSLIDWLPTDREYTPVDQQTVAALIEKYPAQTYIPKHWECEEIAMAFIVDARRDADARNAGGKFNLAIGEALGRKWSGEEKSHHANIFIGNDGVYLFDMQNKRIWKADKGKDDIYFVRM